MDFRHLRSFAAVYEEGSVSKAAVRLHATQPGISIQIAALEAELKAKLFDRHARGIRPTAAGDLLYRRALRILHETADAIGEIKALSVPSPEQITVGIPPTLSRAVLGPILTRYGAQYPTVTIRFVEAYSATLLSLIEARELDLAFVTCSPDHPDLQFQLLYEDRLILVSGAALELPRNRPIRLHEPPYLKLIVPPRRHALHRLLEEALKTKQIVPARLVELDGIIGALQFVSTSSWAALLPMVTAMSCPCETMKLLVNPIAGRPMSVQYFLASRTTAPLSDASRAFVSMAQTDLVAMARDYEAKLHGKSATQRKPHKSSASAKKAETLPATGGSLPMTPQFL